MANEGVVRAHRRAIERTYTGRMSIREVVNIVENSETLDRWETVQKDLPCFLDRSQVNAASNDGTKSSLKQQLRLVCAPEVEIKPGSRIKVEQHNMMIEFNYSGRPFIYPTHQELFIEDSDGT